jgi:hypothetical protein
MVTNKKVNKFHLDPTPRHLRYSMTLGRQHKKAGQVVREAHLPELELEAALLVEYLDPVIVGVRHDDVVLGVHRHTTRLCELALCKIKSY